jgi:hypothetical protein
LDRTQRLLTALGFEVESRAEQQVAARRGRGRPHRGPIDRLPQRVRMDLDRGRVVLAVSIEHLGKPARIHEEILLAIARAIEANLNGDASFSEAFVELSDVHRRVAADARRRKDGKVILYGTLLVILVFMILLLVASTA